MASKAIGTGVCPRCGRPGTVVIKAGNYVYIKHGNTWHYIGTIDKVNLNKILIKDEKIKENNISRRSIERHKAFNNKIMILLIALAIMVTMSISIIFLSSYIDTYKKTNGSSLSFLKCNITKLNNDNIFVYSCINNTNNIISYKYNVEYINNNDLIENNFTSIDAAK
ncbi:hypothetical protein [Vulcanisaeta distributa]|uniref:hypothetical protein n=1 Tax=Vulcanisaeta distributa TaxID=164451 RepID=UPI0006D0D7B9|nr:hypothetical protein [Vulcanisaeta distributa]